MSNRTTQEVVRFMSPFALPGIEALQPPGEYLVGYDEESIDGVSWQAWHRTSSFIHLPAIATIAGVQQMMPIDPAFLEAALEQDRRKT